MGRFNDPRVLIQQISALNVFWRSDYGIENIVKMSESTVRLCSRRRFAKINIDITLNNSDLYDIKAYQLKEQGLWLALIYDEQGFYAEQLDAVLQTIMEKAKQTKPEDYRPVEEFI